MKPLLNKISIAILVIGLIAAGLTLLIRLNKKQPLISPINSNTTFSFLPGVTKKNGNRVVYGFLPYWNIKQVELQPELTNLGYFSLNVAGNGEISTTQEGNIEPGYSKLKSDELLQLFEAAQSKKIKSEIILAQFNNDDIAAFLTSSTAQQRLFKSLDSILLAYPFSGINIDFEYTGEVTPGLKTHMTQFIADLNKHLNEKYSGVTLSIDMYSSAASSHMIWDVEAIGQNVDYIIIMAYDFHRRSSPTAGPVAPIFGGKTMWDSDISDHLQDYLKVVPSSKLLLGVPFYGYEWKTLNGDAQAFTLPDTGTTASYKRVQEILAKKDELQIEEKWNDTALSPYVIYKENGATHIMYYDNSRSLSYKLDFVNQLDLAGIAIWALGYEGDYRELWDIINKKM
jgi:spore germination protein YaaH